MTNTSATGGYLIQSTFPQNEESLVSILQELVVGLTGLDPTLVRPRWQPQPPTQPPVTTNWCALGITEYISTDYPQMVEGVSVRQERFNVLVTFYGPNSTDIAGLFRDGLYVKQNHLVLSAAGVKLRSADAITHVPELVNAQYIPRSDVPVSFMRMLQRVYPIEDFASAQINVFASSGDSCVEIISQ